MDTLLTLLLYADALLGTALMGCSLYVAGVYLYYKPWKYGQELRRERKARQKQMRREWEAEHA